MSNEPVRSGVISKGSSASKQKTTVEKASTASRTWRNKSIDHSQDSTVIQQVQRAAKDSFAYTVGKRSGSTAVGERPTHQHAMVVNGQSHPKMGQTSKVTGISTHAPGQKIVAKLNATTDYSYSIAPTGPKQAVNRQLAAFSEIKINRPENEFNKTQAIAAVNSQALAYGKNDVIPIEQAFNTSQKYGHLAKRPHNSIDLGHKAMGANITQNLIAAKQNYGHQVQRAQMGQQVAYSSPSQQQKAKYIQMQQQ